MKDCSEQEELLIEPECDSCRNFMRYNNVGICMKLELVTKETTDYCHDWVCISD